MATSDWARAKVNLALHITGQRADGYHLLDSIVAFADIGDRITLDPAPRTRLNITGPFAAELDSGPDNLVLRALALLRPGVAANVHLVKNLPVASGIGGGSADAAACLRAACRMTGQPMPEASAILSLGADVPVCLDSRAMRMQGIGDQLAPIDLPDLHAVLVNPGVAVSTAAVFQGLSHKTNRPILNLPDKFGSAAQAIDWLSHQRNDLQGSAARQEPAIKQVLAELARSGALLSRMSGSGATCFGLYDDPDHAATAARRLQQVSQGWWVRQTVFQTARDIT